MEKILLIQPSPEGAWGVYENEDGTQEKIKVDAWVFSEDTDYPEMHPGRRGVSYDCGGFGGYMDEDSNFLGYVGGAFDYERLPETEYLPSKIKK